MRALLALAFLALMALPARAAEKAELWDVFAKSNEQSTKHLTYQTWGSWLSANTVTDEDGVTRVRFDDLDFEQKSMLGEWVNTFANTSIEKYTRAEQLAYWINLYNAATMKEVMNAWPVESIQDIKSGFFTKGPWKKKLLGISGEGVSLDDIEHRILRPGWHDVRVHYALNCASVGCPALAREPYTTANMEKLLDAGARAYINSVRGAFVDDGKLYVSEIYKWYQEDWGGEAEVIAHLKKYANPELAAELEGITGIEDYIPYDWSVIAAR